MDNLYKCEVCGTEVPRQELTNYAAISGLPAICCKTCFEVRDFSDNSIETIAVKSLKRRAEGRAVV